MSSRARNTRFGITLLAAAVLLAGCVDHHALTDHTGLVTGRVVTAPTCPVERVGHECPPRPLSGAPVVALDGTTLRGSTRTDHAGTFRLTLPYGRYELRATNIGGYRSTAAVIVSVSATPVHVTLTLDSGIR